MAEVLHGSPEVGKAFLETVIQHRLRDSEPGNFDTAALSGLKNIQASPGKVTCELFVSPQVQNRYGTLHGGCIATIVDTVGTAALVTQSPKSGVSLSISVDYLSPQPGGNEVEISAQVLKAGKTIATIAVELTQKQTKKLVAVGRHVKFLSGSEDPLLDNGQRPPRSKL